jgi:hypothetical protein
MSDENVIYANNGLTISRSESPYGIRLVFRYDRPEAKGTLILEESVYGLCVLCPDVHPQQPVALLDLFYPSAAGQEIPGGPPLQIEIYSPAQTDDPFGQARCFTEGTRLRFESGVVELKTGKHLVDMEFGYPPD